MTRRRFFARPALAAGLLALAAAGCAGSMPRAYVGGTLEPGMRIAIMPLANYTDRRDASDRVIPVLAVELARQRGVTVIDQGRVETALAQEPWLLMDRLPEDLIAKLGQELDADALLVGSILSCGYRDTDLGGIPEFSLTLRLLKTPGGECLWSGTDSRAGTDRESVFGIGRVDNLERLMGAAIGELVSSLPRMASRPSPQSAPQKVEQP